MYADKLHNYQSDNQVLLGRHTRFSEYIMDFALMLDDGDKGLDLGTGPKGGNSKYFRHCILDGCDVEVAVLDSLGSEYNETFLFQLGKDKLPYVDGELDFVICSCVIQHLNSEEELKRGIEEIKRVLKKGGLFYLMFKIGTHDTTFTYFNDYYKQERTFRVFSPSSVQQICDLYTLSEELLLDDNFIPYCKMILQK